MHDALDVVLSTHVVYAPCALAFARTHDRCSDKAQRIKIMACDAFKCNDFLQVIRERLASNWTTVILMFEGGPLHATGT